MSPASGSPAFDINTSIQRCLVKAIALHGLGLSLWISEDVAEVAPAVVAAPPAKITLKVDDENWAKVSSYIESNKAIGSDAIVKNLEVKYKVSAAVKAAIAKMIG